MKRFTFSLLVLAASIAMMLGGTFKDGQAFTAGSVSISGEQWSASFIPSDDDTGTGLDYFCIICYNADGTLDDIDIRNKPTSNERTTATGPCNATWGPRTLPLSVVLTDPSSRPGLSEDSPAAAGYCGVAWNPPGEEPPPDGDRDSDGVPDSEDACPNTPLGTPVGPDGCPIPTPPPPPPDSDGDGVRDGQDLCPGTPAGTPVDSNGCPVERPDLDEDGDGVPDEIDQCPGTLPGTDVNRRGCERRSGEDPVSPPVAPRPVVVVPGCDVTIGTPDGAVGGTFVNTTESYWMPDLSAPTGVVLEAGKTAKVLGLDATSSFYQIIWNCSYLWVPVGSLGPTYDDLWNGAPLPTGLSE